jgi:putative nucleotidyltransferase with HDIG domain
MIGQPSDEVVIQKPPAALQRQVPKQNRSPRPEDSMDKHAGTAHSTPDGPAKILIIDDEPNILSVLVSLLGNQYKCTAVTCAMDALQCLRHTKYDLVLSDIMMPGMDGFELTEEIRVLDPDTVIVLISGNLNIQSAIEAIRKGAFDYVTKPFRLDSVEMAVKRALRHRLLLRANRTYERHLEEMVGQRTEELSARNRELNVALERLYVNYRATLRGLAFALETRDNETRGHSDRVVAYCIRLGRQLQLKDQEMVALECGALLHDLGKIGVPDKILFKPGPLTNEEWVLMRRHVEHGARILSGIEFLADASKVVSQHHEKYDGSGYLNGLAGQDIYIGARVFAVADAIDAFTSDRPYRAGRPFEVVGEELHRCSGSHFDPSVVNGFDQIPLDEWRELRLAVSQSKDFSLGHSLERDVVMSFLAGLS